MFCNKCGTVVPDDSVFCHKCGYKFAIPLVQTPTPTQTTTPQPVIYPAAEPQPAPQPIAPTPAPQPAVAPQPIQYAPQPAPQPQIITAPQPIQYAPQPQVTPAPQPVVTQAQYQQPAYQPQMTYAPVSTIAHTPKKPFNAKKSAAIVAISVPVGSFLGEFIGTLIVVLLGNVKASILYDIAFDSPDRIRIDNLFYFINDVIYEIVPLIVFFLLYYIFSKGNRKKAPRFIWIVFYSAYNVFLNLLHSTLEQIFYTPNIPAKYDPDIYEELFYISTTITLVSFLFACIVSYIIAAIILYQLYSGFDSNGRIIHNRLLLKNRLPLDKKGAMLYSLCVPVTMLVNLIIGLISDKIPMDIPPALSPIFFKTIYIGISIVFAVIFISNKKFSGIPQTLKLLICAFMSRFYFRPINSYYILLLFYNTIYLSDAQLETSNVLYYIFDFPIELLCSFALMYSILKDLAAPAHKFPPELIVQKAPATTE